MMDQMRDAGEALPIQTVQILLARTGKRRLKEANRRKTSTLQKELITSRNACLQQQASSSLTSGFCLSYEKLHKGHK